MASIFSLTALLAATVFANIQTTQRGVLSRQRVVADGRYILEAMARTAKLGLPDYGYYQGGSCENSLGGTSGNCNLLQPQSVLAVRDQANVQTCYRWNVALSSLETNNNCTATTGWSDITPEDLRIEDFRVYIKPIGDPFRVPPSSASDCPSGVSANGGFDPVAGVCKCSNLSVLQDCFAGQTCVAQGTGNVCKNPDTQPAVTIYLKTSAITGGLGQPITSTIQTTVVSRVYRR